MLEAINTTEYQDAQGITPFVLLQRNRTIFIMSPIDTQSMASFILELFSLDSLSHDPIHIYICSPGGSVMDGFAIIDAMGQVHSPIYTYALGLVASMASIIFMYGDKRYMAAHAQIMLHQPLGGFNGQASDIEITARKILELKATINHMVATRCHRDIALVTSETDRDMYLDVQAAIDYGIADAITQVINNKQAETNE